MRVKEYKDVEIIIDGLKRIASRYKYTKISGIMENSYAEIAEQKTGIPSDRIEGVYSIGKIDDIYNIVVVYNGYKSRDILAKPMHTIIRGSANNYSDVTISFAGEDIYTDFLAIYTLAYDIMLPAPQDDIYWVYCFFNAFKGLYTHDDVKAVTDKLAMVDIVPDIIERMIEAASCENPGFIPDALFISEAVKYVKQNKSENTNKETK